METNAPLVRVVRENRYRIEKRNGIYKTLAEELPVGKTFLWEDEKFRFDGSIDFHSVDGDIIRLSEETRVTVLSVPMWISVEDSYYSGFYLLVKAFNQTENEEIVGTLRF